MLMASVKGAEHRPPLIYFNYSISDKSIQLSSFRRAKIFQPPSIKVATLSGRSKAVFASALAVCARIFSLYNRWGGWCEPKPTGQPRTPGISGMKLRLQPDLLCLMRSQASRGAFVMKQSVSSSDLRHGLSVRTFLR